MRWTNGEILKPTNKATQILLLIPENSIFKQQNTPTCHIFCGKQIIPQVPNSRIQLAHPRVRWRCIIFCTIPAYTTTLLLRVWQASLRYWIYAATHSLLMYEKASNSLGRSKDFPVAISPPNALRVCVQVLLHHGTPKVITKVPFFQSTTSKMWLFSICLFL